MISYLCAWIGRTDLRARSESESIGIGPIANAVSVESYDAIHLLCDFPSSEAKSYVRWLEKHTQDKVVLHQVKLSSPIDFGEIYMAAASLLNSIMGEQVRLTFHLSPGTPAMQSVWMLLGKTLYPARLIQSSEASGIQEAVIPFDISAEFIPALLKHSDQRISAAAQASALATSTFGDIIYRSDVMSRAIEQAKRVATRSITVLLEGESGTGKELFARAIHREGPRAARPFIAINCGAISPELAESELFGHKKGAFTGAHDNRKGCFEQANGGTLFLDEIGDLPLPLQVKLLRTLQESEVTPVGSSLPIKIDVRIIAATNKNLMHEITMGRFREDLFYRLAVGVIKLPPLKDRKGDLGVLIDRLLENLNHEATRHGAPSKRLSPGAKTVAMKHDWPGNVRELLNTLQRAVTWSDEDEIDSRTMSEAILSRFQKSNMPKPIHDIQIGAGMNLQEVVADVARRHIRLAMEKTNNNKTRSAQLLGFNSHQTLTNWMNRYGVSE